MKYSIAIVLALFGLLCSVGCTKKAVGSVCEGDDDCRSGHCFNFKERSRKTCSKVCARDQDCPHQTVCFAGYDRCVAKAAAPIGKPCKLSMECNRGLCIKLIKGHPLGFCSQLCRTDKDCAISSKCKRKVFVLASGNVVLKRYCSQQKPSTAQTTL